MNSNFNKNLTLLLKLFKNRPYHLAKYLIDNNAFTDQFLKKISESNKLNQISQEEAEIPYYFSNISQMEEFYNSLLEEVKELSKLKSLEDVTDELNRKLNNLISEEKFEEAAQLRDYMFKNGIKRKSN